MAVPSQQQLHRPILEMVSQTEEEIVSLRQIKSALIQHFSLEDKDLAESVPSGQNRFTNRVYWAVSYLKRAGLLEAPNLAHFKMTQRGRQTLAKHKGDIESKQLKDLIDSRLHQSLLERENVAGTIEDSIGATPDEQMEALYRELNDKLADELLDSVRRVSPDRFELLVVRLLEKMGYGKGQAVGRSGDGGIDGIIDQDQLGLEKVYIQAKRWQSPVGEPEIRNFSGSLLANGASRGVIIATSTFGAKAQETAKNISAGNQFIRLIDGVELVRLMIRYDVGVVTETTYNIKKLDENYLSEEL